MARTIVLVDDNPADSKILLLALTERDATIETVTLKDGAKALDFFSQVQKEGRGSQFDLILLDLNLPRVSGFEVLEFLKGEPGLRKIPVVVLSSSSRQQDIDRCYEGFANSYITKPVGYDEVFHMASQLVSYWFECAKRPERLKVMRTV